jgi:hypothetical protein
MTHRSSCNVNGRNRVSYSTHCKAVSAVQFCRLLQTPATPLEPRRFPDSLQTHQRCNHDTIRGNQRRGASHRSARKLMLVFSACDRRVASTPPISLRARLQCTTTAHILFKRDRQRYVWS